MPRGIDQKTARAIGARVRQLRNERGLSQTELGKLMGVAFQQIQKYEKGTNVIGSHRIASLCKALGVTPDDIYRIDLPHAHTPVPMSNYAIRTAIKLDKLDTPQKRVVTTLVNSFLNIGGDDDDE